MVTNVPEKGRKISTLAALETEEERKILAQNRKKTGGKDETESRKIRDLREAVEKKELEITGLKNQLTEISDMSMGSHRELEFIKERLMNVEKMAALGKMFISLANDLNNLLSGIIGYSQLLMGNADCPESMRKELEVIQNQSHRTYKLIRGLLAFSHLQKIEREPVNIQEILEYIIGMKKHYLQLDDIHLKVDFAGDLPEISGNPDSLHHLFINIVNNAQQALKNHPGERTISIITRFEKGNIKVLFRDTGPGVPKEFRDKIFDPFFSTWGEKESLGLGLATSYGIVSEHGGNIYYEDAPGGGALFIVEFPCRRDVQTIKPPFFRVEGAAAPARAVKKGLSSAKERKHKKILIVDDEEAILTMLTNALGMEGFLVTGTTDGQKALSLIDKEDFDMIIADMKMPLVSGINLYWFVEKKKPELLDRIIFITGDIIDTTTRSFLKTIDNPYFTKPFDVEKFTAVIRNLINA